MLVLSSGGRLGLNVSRKSNMTQFYRYDVHDDSGRRPRFYPSRDLTIPVGLIHILIKPPCWAVEGAE